MRVDSTNELTMFIDELRSCGVEIPQNVTLEIDSDVLKKELSREVNGAANTSIDVSRGEMYGTKITFKQKTLK